MLGISGTTYQGATIIIIFLLTLDFCNLASFYIEKFILIFYHEEQLLFDVNYSHLTALLYDKMFPITKMNSSIL